MNIILTSFKYLAALALATLAVGCASNTAGQQDMAVAAGFKIITPSKPDQQAILAKLPAGQVTPITYNGKGYYVLPDAAKNQAYVGGPAEYQTYQQLRLAKQLSNENLQAAEMNQNASMNNWGAWGGWGAVGPVGRVGFRR